MTRNRFDLELSLLSRQLTTMGNLCETAINTATKALLNGNINQAREVIEADAEIDQCEKDIERLCLKLLLQQQPVARDLRQISAALKMITDMERIGDQASDIAEIIISANITEASNFALIGQMSQEAARMVTDSVSSYVSKNLELAGRVEANDDIVDRMFSSVRKELTDSIVKKNGVNAEHEVDLIMVSKYLERIADHATNIAEWVAYSITGVHEGAVDTKKI
ncbi:MAG: phosphate signaling complex protein PhoU [Lachnospiraceae bacterium]|nr:phosphate signaling complex protein PhoU [Lachnospiraceae bacterium]NLC75714.1 phosphate signaling complex protein PhoU [Clostridiales bacterium]